MPRVRPQVADAAPDPGDHSAHPQVQAGLHTLRHAPSLQGGQHPPGVVSVVLLGAGMGQAFLIMSSVVTKHTDAGVRDPVSSILKNHPALLWREVARVLQRQRQHYRDGVVKPLRDGVSIPGGVEAVHGNHPIWRKHYSGVIRLHHRSGRN